MKKKKKSLVGWIEHNCLWYWYDGWKPRKCAKVIALFKNKQKDGIDGYYHSKVRITIEEI